MFEIVVGELREVADRFGRCGVPADADAILEMRSVLDRLESIVAAAEIGFDSSEGWRERGSGSLRSWLADEGGLARAEAARVSRRAQRLGSWPVVAEAWVEGSLCGAQVEQMCAAVPRRFVSLFAEHSSVVVSAVSGLDAFETSQVLREWVRMAEASDDGADLRERPSGLHLDTTFDGRAVLQGEFDPASAAVIAAALRDFDVPDELDADGDPIGEVRTVWQRRADALVAVCSFAIAHRDGPGDAGRHLPHVSLVVDLPELMASSLRGAGVRTEADLDGAAERNGWGALERAWFADALARRGDGTTFDGVEVAGAAAALLSCDSVVQRVLTVEGGVIDLGREVRTAPAPLRRAVITRDRHCRAPGCQRQARFCDVHHVDHWVDGGRTDLDRLVLLCTFHHHLFHQPGWSMEFDQHARLSITRPDGRVRTTSPPGARAPAFRT